MNESKLDKLFLILIWGILFLSIIFSFAHYGQIIIDSGREVYYPVQILSGKILYKDIFNIYGPFAYMFNAFLFKIFGINLNVLYVAGCFCAFSVVTLIYMISNHFLTKFLSFSISIFTIAIGVLNTNLFNFVFPYSYGMLYGIIGFLVSFLFLVKYSKAPEKTFFLYISGFFAGLCVASKYEFFLYLILIFYAMFKVKSLKLSQYYYAIFSCLFVPAFCFGILFLQGVDIHDLITTAQLIKKMMASQTLKYFYISQGVYFNLYTPIFLLKHFIITAVPLSLFVLAFKIRNKALFIASFIILCGVMFYSLNEEIFAFFPLLIVILIVFNLKNIIKNIPLMLLAFGSVFISVKVFWGLVTLNYGVFFESFLLITALALVFDILKNKNKDINYKAIAIYILVISICLGIKNIQETGTKDSLVSSNYGKIYTTEFYYKATDKLIYYIEKNTKKTDSILILPEGLMVNFLTNRKSDNYYSSLIPLYVETFGEKNIINHLKNNKPDYIVFNNFDTSNYYFHNICNDYAFSLCRFVAENYTQKEVIDEGFRYLIFKKKN